MDYYQLRKVILLFCAFLSCEVKQGNVCALFVMPQAPLYFQYVPVANCLATPSLTDGISISSQADRWLCLQAASPQCQQKTEMVPHIYIGRGKKCRCFSPQWMGEWKDGFGVRYGDISVHYLHRNYPRQTTVQDTRL